MVIRIQKRTRKYLGARRWGAGNIKNARGAGDRGGTGKGGRKHKWTSIVKYAPERIRSKGFANKNPSLVLKETDIYSISNLANASEDAKPTVELKGYKVLSDGMLDKPVVVKAAAFSKAAQEKIKKAGGEAIKV
ncbi:MAG: uL15 family ribosomal protein [Candidatus Micrarchaeota archaeon]|nr:uL15 family ribosomal protein [Candidatus Micrarchaeota archaeon]MDE1848320.1 uL15 family ribosomal protein [Candidatus Micrarchaeota archaeon]MDE1864546.1 uL15 family ribosomal protein [Candidatus Micrarchaeota archaeon]